MGSIGTMLPQLCQLSLRAGATVTTGRHAQHAVPSHQPFCCRNYSRAGRSLQSELAAHRASNQQHWPVAGRRHVAVKAQGRWADGMPEMDDKMMERIEASTKIIGELIMEVSRDIFVAEAAGEITGETESTASLEKEAIRKAVASRIDTLDEAFLVTLMGFVQASEAEGDTGMAARLRGISEEVLRAVRSHLPPEVQLLDLLMGLAGSVNRLEMLRVAADGGDGAEVPAVALDRLDTTAATLIDDMEDKEQIPDRGLLAKVCLVREEIQNVDRERQLSRTGRLTPLNPVASLRQGVPRKAVAFLKELMAVSESEMRVALLKKAFISDWEGAAPGGAAAADPKSDTSKASAVRPGQFLTTLNITQGEMLKPEAGVSDVILTRLEDVRRETLQVLVEMAGG